MDSATKNIDTVILLNVTEAWSIITYPIYLLPILDQPLRDIIGSNVLQAEEVVHWIALSLSNIE